MNKERLGRIVLDVCGMSRRRLCFGAIVVYHLVVRSGRHQPMADPFPLQDVIDIRCTFGNKEQKDRKDQNENEKEDEDEEKNVAGKNALMSHPQLTVADLNFFSNF